MSGRYPRSIIYGLFLCAMLAIAATVLVSDRNGTNGPFTDRATPFKPAPAPTVRHQPVISGVL